ncbi:MAG: hypothetical protein AAF799_23260 [Myxococcota bacterium]
MAEWSPAQLDRLEDALEELEQEGGLERWLEDEPGVGDPLRERLTDYRDILVASREALPMEEVPSGLLDGVFEEARRAAATPAVAAAKEPWWRRLRRSFLVPTVALAGTAALVFWIGRPESQPTSADMPSPESAEAAAAQPVERAEKTRKRGDRAVAPADAEGDAEQSLEEEEQAKAEAEPDEPPPPPAAVPQSAAPTRAQTYDEGELGVKIDGKLDDAKGADTDKTGKVLGGVPTEPEVVPGSGSAGRWDLITAGDQARQAGDCVGARQSYAVALEDDEAAVRARAYAGMGLCDAQQGNSAAADSNYERARELDGASIDDFLDSQRDHGPPKTSRPKRSKKKKAKPRSKSSSSKTNKAINMDQMSDPFG